jgi:DNA-directed RNA polymerase specialized sigma24 family protein
VSAREANWDAVLQGDRDAFQRMVAPHVPELLKAAQRELRYYVALDDIDVHDLTAPEIVGEALTRTWRDRRHRPAEVSTRAWLLSDVLKTAESVIRRESQQKRELTTNSLDYLVPTEPVHSYEEPFELAPFEEVLNAPSATEEQGESELDRFAHALPRRVRHVFIMQEFHRVPLHEIAVLVGISELEAEQLLVGVKNSRGGARSF